MAYVRVLPVTVHVQQEVGGADRERDLVPEAVGKAVGEGLRARLSFEAVVVADLLSHAAALQLKVTAVEENRSEVKDAQGSQGRALWMQDTKQLFSEKKQISVIDWNLAARTCRES